MRISASCLPSDCVGAVGARVGRDRLFFVALFFAGGIFAALFSGLFGDFG